MKPGSWPGLIQVELPSLVTAQQRHSVFFERIYSSARHIFEHESPPPCFDLLVSGDVDSSFTTRHAQGRRRDGAGVVTAIVVFRGRHAEDWGPVWAAGLWHRKASGC